MTRSAATHNGTCQVCGNLQALPGGALSLHGYTVPHGYFNGICPGQRHAPLELDRALADKIAADLLKQYQELTTKAEGISLGTIRPKYAGINRHCKNREGRTVEIVVLYADATEYQQRAAVESYLYATQSHAKHAKDTSLSITALADRIHGKPLTPRVDESRKVIVPGCKITTGGRQYVVLAVEEREARSWSARQRFGKHAAVENSKGQRFWIPCSSIRQDKIEL